MSGLRIGFLSLTMVCVSTACGFALQSTTTAPTTRPATSPAQKISLQEFERLRAQKDVIVVDVRSTAEFEEGHIAGAVNIPILPDKPKAFDEQAGKLDKDKRVLVHCAVGGRSKRAVARMEKLGFQNLSDFAGGIAAWEEAGKPVEKPAPPKPE